VGQRPEGIQQGSNRDRAEHRSQRVSLKALAVRDTVQTRGHLLLVRRKNKVPRVFSILLSSCGRGCVVAIAEEASTRPGITTSRLEAPDRQPGGTLKQPTRHQEQRRAVAAEQPAQSKQPPKRRGGRGRCSHKLLPCADQARVQLEARKDFDDDRTKRASGRSQRGHKGRRAPQATANERSRPQAAPRKGKGPPRVTR